MNLQALFFIGLSLETLSFYLKKKTTHFTYGDETNVCYITEKPPFTIQTHYI